MNNPHTILFHPIVTDEGAKRVKYSKDPIHITVWASNPNEALNRVKKMSDGGVCRPLHPN